MAQANTISAGQRSDRSVRPVSGTATVRSAFFPALLDHIAALLPGPKVARQLADILGCEERSAFRYLAGERTPGGNEVAALLEHPVTGPMALAYIAERIAADLSDKDRARFVNQMAKATLRAMIRDTNEGAE